MIKYILDTDHLSLIQRNNQEGKNILKKLMAFENPEIAVTIITYEEMVNQKRNEQNLIDENYCS